MKSQLIELACLIQEAQSLDELLGSLHEWARSIAKPIEPDKPLPVQIVRAINNYRQEWAIQQASAHGRITTQEVATRYHIAPETARLDLMTLCIAGDLRAVGDKRGRFYIPVAANTSDIPQIIGERVSDPVAGQQTIDPFTADI